MRKLMSAEWYRLRHSGAFIVIILLAVFIPVIIPFFMEYSVKTADVTASEVLYIIATNAPFFAVMIPVAIGASISSSYSNKIAYYEVMDGNSIHKIILSKLFVHTSFATVSYWIPTATFLLWAYMKNGTDLWLEDFSVTLILYIILLLRSTIGGTLFVTLTRSPIGAALPYIRLMLESMTDIIFTESNPLYKFMPSTQMMAYLMDPNDKSIIWAIVLTTIFEIAALYICSYIGFKKKHFK